MSYRIIKQITEKVLKILISLDIYGSIIWGILDPMMISLGGVSISLFLIESLFGLLGFGYWEYVYFPIDEINYIALLIFESIIFSLGVGLFVISFVQLVREKVRGQGLVQTGIYGTIRHPQNFSLIFLVLPFSLYIPGFKDWGIRVADLIFLVHFIYFMIIFSYVEEHFLKKKYPEEFQQYVQNTGFMIPIINKFAIFKRRNIKIKPSLKIALYIISYILIIGIIFATSNRFRVEYSGWF